MSTAFTLTLAYLAEQCSARATASAFAAYITGNVASNLFGRLMSAGLADHLGLAANFYVFAVLNLAGAALVYFTLKRTPPVRQRFCGQPFTACRPGRASGQRAALCQFRHRFPDPVHLHRHLHLCELRAGAPAAGSEPHAARLRLFRVPACDHHDAARRQCRAAASAPGRPSGAPVRGGGRPAAAADAQPRRRAASASP